MQGSQFFIEDLGSANGTFINGQLRLTPKKPHVLVSGDEVKLGETTLKFVVTSTDRTTGARSPHAYSKYSRLRL